MLLYFRRGKFNKVIPEEEAIRQYDNRDQRRVSQRAVFDRNSLNDPSARLIPLEEN